MQVIVYTEYPGQAPRIVEDQVTYPLTTQLLAVPYAKVVRGYSFFGYSFAYVIFEDGTDLYWGPRTGARNTEPCVGQAATGGYAFPRARCHRRRLGVHVRAHLRPAHDLGELRSIQDWFLKYELASVPGVSEVASIGGFVQQYQITVDPNRLRAYGIPFRRFATPWRPATTTWAVAPSSSPRRSS